MPEGNAQAASLTARAVKATRDFQEAQLKRKQLFLGNANNICTWCWGFSREFELELNQEQFQGLKYLPQKQKSQGSTTLKTGLLGFISLVHVQLESCV